LCQWSLLATGGSRPSPEAGIAHTIRVLAKQAGNEPREKIRVLAKSGYK